LPDDFLLTGLDGLEFSPYIKNMHKRGDIRDDGRVFYSKSKGSIGGEYWMEMDQFLRTCGQDYYERIVAYREYLAEMKRTKDARALKKREARIERYHKTKHLTAAKRKASRERSYAKMLLDPTRLEKHKAKQVRSNKRYKEKQMAINAEKKAKRKAEQETLKKIKQDQVNAKRVEREKASAERKLAKSMRPKRVVLTEEQRKESKRQGKRNYKHRRRARLRGLESKATTGQIREAKAKAKNKCFYCSMRVEMLTIDHILPICSGGSHTLDNIVFACHACNSRKSGTHPNTFGREFGLLLV
jgi:5-methylcytosine-specific restriction endonuclease McrA